MAAEYNKKIQRDIQSLMNDEIMIESSLRMMRLKRQQAI